jgi:hypothetical protein
MPPADGGAVGADRAAGVDPPGRVEAGDTLEPACARGVGFGHPLDQVHGLPPWPGVVARVFGGRVLLVAGLALPVAAAARAAEQQIPEA